MPLQDQLSPTQRNAHAQLVAALPAGNIFELRSKPGRGRTTVLSSIHAAKGGAFLTVRNFVDCLNTWHPLALDEALYEVLLDALREHDCVIVDDFHVATAVPRGCGFYPRNGLLNAPMTVVAAYAAATGKRLILGGDGQLPEALSQRCFSYSIGRFAVSDYRHLCAGFLGANRGNHLDLEKVYRFAPTSDRRRQGTLRLRPSRGPYPSADHGLLPRGDRDRQSEQTALRSCRSPRPGQPATATPLVRRFPSTRKRSPSRSSPTPCGGWEQVRREPEVLIVKGGGYDVRFDQTVEGQPQETLMSLWRIAH
jgi:hypothetical protein